MRAWIWMGAALLVACRGRRSAPDTHCSPVDAILMPMEAERAELLQKFPPSSPERWVERSIIDEDAAVALEEAALPEALSDTARAAYIAYLRELSAKSAELAEEYNAIADFDKSQDALREQIDALSAELKRICDKGGENGCTFEPPLPDDPEGTVASLRGFVEQGRRAHAQEPLAEAIWQKLLAALTERIAAMEEEAQRTGSIEFLEAAFEALSEKEGGLREALVESCPSDLREAPEPTTEADPAVAPAPTPQQGLPPIEGQPAEGGIPEVPTMPAADGGHNFAQPLDPASAPGGGQSPPPLGADGAPAPAQPPPDGQ